eukprot:GHVH01000172.1.p1 GENE.GHVH01000172.1~~GHVH01000172.1.p1  ORF type:complete len:651 (-),score=57.76 GHVH01000172.1:381-2333(-)
MRQRKTAKGEVEYTDSGAVHADTIATSAVEHKIAALGSVQVKGTNLTKSPRYYDFKQKSGSDYRGRPLHDTVHWECRDSTLSQKESLENLHGFFVLFCCIATATAAKNIMSNLRRYGMVVLYRPAIDPALLHDLLRVVLAILFMFMAASLVYIIQTSFDTSTRPLTQEDEVHLHREKAKASMAPVRGRFVRGMSDSWTDLQNINYSQSELNSDNVRRARSLSNGGDASMRCNNRHEHWSAPSLPIRFDRRRGLSIAVIFAIYLAGHYFVSTQFDHWMFRGLTLLGVVTMVLKLISFVHVCQDYRRAFTQGTPWAEIGGTNEDIEMFMKNKRFLAIFSFTHFVRFWCMPTLIFQFSYPMAKSTNWAKVLMHGCLFFTWAIAIWFIKRQYIQVSLHELFTSSDWTDEASLVRLGSLFAEYTFRLAAPLVISWILFFLMCTMFFHHGMNITAELTRFGDRRFYEDWWNSEGFGEYWRKWNMPVHNFATRHIYKPLLSIGIPNSAAGVIVFAISAWAHEYLINTTWQIPYTYLVFASFLAQLPMIVLIDDKLSGYKGNIVFWVVFCVTGQPIAMAFIYYIVGTTEGYIEPRTLGLSDSTEAAMLIDVVSKLLSVHEDGLSNANVQAFHGYLDQLRQNLEYGQSLLSIFANNDNP